MENEVARCIAEGMAEKTMDALEKKVKRQMGDVSEDEMPAGLGKLYIAPGGVMNNEHLQPIELHSVAIDLGDGESHASESTWGNNDGNGYCITGTGRMEISKETRKNLQKLMRGQGRLPRKEKKRMRNSILRNKRALIFVLISTMIDYSTAFNNAAVLIFSERPRTTDVEGYDLIQLNNAEWHAVDTLVRHLYKHRITMLKRLWQRNRNLFPEV
jgi:hypothetical protein